MQQLAPGATTQILSVVTVVNLGDGSAGAGLAALLPAVQATLAATAMPYELVLVLNGLPPAAVAVARAAVGELPDVQVYVLRTPVDATTACLAGLEHAVGDWVASYDLQADCLAELPRLLQARTAAGVEVVLGVPTGKRRLPLGHRLLSSLFRRLFHAVHGFQLREQMPAWRLLSRAVVNAVVQHDRPRVALDTLSALFSQSLAEVPIVLGAAAQPRLGQLISGRWQVLIGLNAMPLRLANALCGGGALLAVLYSGYVTLVYAIKRDVVPGWTTLSLMLSCMFFMLSGVLWLLCEYIVMLCDTRLRRPHYDIAQEFHSSEQTRRRRLNVEAAG